MRRFPSQTEAEAEQRRKKGSTKTMRTTQRTQMASQVAIPGIAQQLPAAIIPLKFSQAIGGIGMALQRGDNITTRDRFINFIQGALALTQFIISTILFIGKETCDATSSMTLCIYNDWLGLVFSGTLLLGWGISEASRQPHPGEIDAQEASFREGYHSGRLSFTTGNPRARSLPTPSRIASRLDLPNITPTIQPRVPLRPAQQPRDTTRHHFFSGIPTHISDGSDEMMDLEGEAPTILIDNVVAIPENTSAEVLTTFRNEGDAAIAVNEEERRETPTP